jgi:hypothetical protein
MAALYFVVFTSGNEVGFKCLNLNRRSGFPLRCDMVLVSGYEAVCLCRVPTTGRSNSDIVHLYLFRTHALARKVIKSFIGGLK